MTGFEPATFCTQNKRATKLRYIPFNREYFHSIFHIKKKSILFSTFIRLDSHLIS